MSSPVINQDMILEILSYFSAPDIGKFKLLNKETNKRSYESWFLNLSLHRTNSISDYFIQYDEGRYKFETGLRNNGISLDFLPPGRVKIEACDAGHGIFLCISDRETEQSEPEYIVCKPATKQFQIIPNPKMRNRAISFGLAVIQSNPFRYKILRLSKRPGIKNRNLRTFVCEVFDSYSFTWKRLRNLRLPRKDGLILSNPVQASGFLNWVSWDNNVIRFCLKTETWSFLRTPNFGVSPKLVRYEGKLGVICWSGYGGEGFNRLWVLKSSFEKSWVKVKDIKDMGVNDDFLWYPSNDAVTIARRERVCLYNINTEKLKIIHITKKELVPRHSSYVYFPFCSNYERVDLNGDRSNCCEVVRGGS